MGEVSGIDILAHRWVARMVQPAPVGRDEHGKTAQAWRAGHERMAAAAATSAAGIDLDAGLEL